MDELGIEPPPPRDEESNWVDTLLYSVLGGLIVMVLFSRMGCDPAGQMRALLERVGDGTRDDKPAKLDDPGGRSSAYVTAYNQAVQLANAQRWQEALGYAEAASRAESSGLDNASRAAAPLLRGQILTALRRHDEAVWAIEQARGYATSPQLHEALAIAQFQKQDYRQALAHARDYVDGGGPPKANIYFILGYAYDRLGETDQATQWVRRGREEFPKDENLSRLNQKYARDAVTERGMQTVQDGRFVLKFMNIPEQAQRRDETLRALQSAYSRVCDAYGFQPREALPVILYPTSGAYYQGSGAPAWSAAQYDGKIRVPLSSNDARGLDAVIAHELTHYVIHEIAGDKVPAWLDEGLAQIAEGRDESWATTTLNAASARFTLEQLTPSFTRISDATQARVAYAQALLTTRRLVDQIGSGRMRGVLDALAQGRRIEELVNLR